ncbi:MAG: nicotinate (nicotinamide) nucleotide adenylyltransferase [Victivallaceae bacterium]|nr:nicotinate (nicotinamide) nucleotide adenylyltransferase [Victivallaceae bacterium]
MASAFFGGSFDPPHSGHLAVALAALASGRCDFVRWVVGACPPHKPDARRAPFADRLAMVGLLTQGRDDMAPSDLELSLPSGRPTYTIEALAAYEKRYGERCALLIGADSLVQLHTWKRAGELVANYEIITYPRQGARVDRDALRSHWDDATAGRLADSVLDGELFDVSSTEIRGGVAGTGLPADEAVAKYIGEHGLYAVGNRG